MTAQDVQPEDISAATSADVFRKLRFHVESEHQGNVLEPLPETIDEVPGNSDFDLKHAMSSFHRVCKEPLETHRTTRNSSKIDA